MFDETSGATADDTGAPWRPAAESWFRQQLGEPWRVAAFVVDQPEVGPISAACGICDDRPPGPATLSSVRGYVSSVATDPAHRRRGHARACVEALLDWFRNETAAEIIELKASPDGAGLYAALGFQDCEDPTRRLVLR